MSWPLLRWVVQSPIELQQLLENQGLLGALADERVFVDGQRETSKRELAVGAVVEIYAPRPRADITVLGEYAGVYAINKPAALPTEPDKSGASSVVRQLALQLKCEPRDLFAISRLDVGVSGVLLVALGSLARERLLAERARGALRRRYVALGCGVPQPAVGDWREALGKQAGGKRAVGGRDEQSAHTSYRVIAEAASVAPSGPRTALLALSPVTGRTHQLRVHASAHAAPLLGDRKYGGPARMTRPDGSVQGFAQVLLHAAWVEWGPSAARQRVSAEPGSDFAQVWLDLGGDLTAIQRALD
jgi:23S rRNA-/tRNA-specific pseudouridylate synthase